MGDKPLDHAIILDTEDDLGTKLIIMCDCGVDLEVSQIREEPEKAIVLVVHCCENCKQVSFSDGYNQNDRDRQSMGY
jgi:hypothetical protein